MNDMKKWADREIELALGQEKSKCKYPGEFEYVEMCYSIASKAFNSIMDGNPSGTGVEFARHLLTKLLDGRPLTPIEDTDDIWEELPFGYLIPDCRCYQCNRMPSLFKFVRPDGTCWYSDSSRIKFYDYSCYLLGESVQVALNSLLEKLIDSEFPITMPYNANVTCKVYITQFSFKVGDGDWDTVALHTVKPSNRSAEYVNRYYKRVGRELVKISKTEYDYRYEHSVDWRKPK